jgi:hypothetical protein
MPFASGMTDTSGEVSLPFQNVGQMGLGQLGLGLTGYLKITAPTIIPYYYYWGFPLSASEFYSRADVTTPSELQGILTALNVTQDTARGIVTVVTYDCQMNAASRVEVTLSTADALTRAFSPTTGAATTTTDQSGLIAFTNVLAGTVQITATPTALGTASSRVGAIVRAGSMTTVLAVPTP